MPGNISEIGPISFTTQGDERSFKEMISKLDLKPPVVIKPNWSSSMDFTESKILDWTLSAIDVDSIVVESYAMWRNEIFLDPTQVRDNRFLELLRKQRKDDLRANDEWFLKFTGIKDVLDRHDVEYLNISEELWAGRVCNATVIQNEVENQFAPVTIDSLVASVPTRIYELRGGTLLSLAKPKRTLKERFVSLSMKNLFGMIPTPYRIKYHGENESLLSQSIVDINKIYHALFEVKGLIEGVFTASETIDNPMAPKLHKNSGFIWVSRNLLELDALVSYQLGINPNEVEYLKKATEAFGTWNEKTENFGRKNPVDFPFV